MLTISVKTDVERATAWLAELSNQVPYATAVALNATAFDVRAELAAEVQRVFDRPTPYIASRTLRVARATKLDLRARVGWEYIGGKGVDSADILCAEILGGPRKLKRFERALHAAGLLPSGMVAVPGQACKLDNYGNVSAGFIVKLLSYLGAFAEQGYRANTTAAGRARTARRVRTKEGFVRIAGVEYFVSHGRGERNGRMQHLPAGIWSRRGIHGSDISPVMMFVRRPTYRPRLHIDRVAQRVVAARFAHHFEVAIAQAIRTAR